VSIDSTDALAFCGTRSGDLLEVALNRGIYNRSGPVEKKFNAGISQIVSKFKNIYIGANDGTFAKIDKKTLCISGEVNFPDSSITALTASESKVYCITNRSIVRSVAD
jgi:cilia- and flagella-associated protein 52